MPAKQTIARDLRFQGITLHRGVVVSVRLRPAPADSGIVFCRVDQGLEIASRADKVGNTWLATTLEQDGVCVGTVEHLLSALAALRVDDIIIELDGDELPILDGSASPWLVLIRACGIAEQDAPRRAMRIIKPVEVVQDARRVCWQPCIGEQPTYQARIDFPHAMIRRTDCTYQHTLTVDAYTTDIARARTFCYVNDVEAMHRNRRALGGSLQNAVVIDDDKVINKDGLRYPNEFVRHKILDAIGDSYIGGTRIIGSYIGDSPGHDLNNLLMRRLLDTPDAWEWTDAA